MYPPRFPHAGDKMRNAERIFFDACSNQLDDSWTVLYEVQWFGRRNQGNERGDADFLLMNSKYGIFCVEVKGGQQIFVKDNQWYTVPRGLTDAVKIRDPFVQAAESKSVLWSFLKEKIAGIQLSGALGHFVVFPGVNVGDDVSLSARKALICDKASMKNLPGSIEKISKVLAQKNVIDEIQIEKIRKAILPNFELISQSQNKIDESRNFMDELTASQLEAFSMLNNWREFRVLGGAGTGKTSLAFYRAKQLAAQGARILYLCSSPSAAKYLRSLLEPDLNQTLLIESIANYFDKFLMTTTENSKKFIGNKTYKSFLIEYFIIGIEMPLHKEFEDKFLEFAIVEKLFFDGLIIDEGQNISLRSIDLLVNLLPDRGSRYLYVFGDRKQNIFNLTKSALDFDTENPEVELKTNCRSTAEIVAAAGCFFGPKKEVSGAVGLKPLLLYSDDVSKSYAPPTSEKGPGQWSGIKEPQNLPQVVAAARYLIEVAGLEPTEIQHIVNSLWNMMHKFIRQYSLVIDTSQWSFNVNDESSTEIKKFASNQFLLEANVLSEMVGLESDGLIVEVDLGLPSYWLAWNRADKSEIFKEKLSEQSLLFNAFEEAFRKKCENIRNKKFPIGSIVDVASKSEVWTEIFEGFKTALYTTISRARLAVVIIGDVTTLELIWEILGDRCERVFIDEVERQKP